MFTKTRAFSGFAVPDIAAAKDFYGGTLGLEVTEEDDLLTLHIAGGRPVLVYAKPDHAPATYTILNFPVQDVEEAVDRLTAAGVPFEIYTDGPIATDARGVWRGEGPTIAWFRDPAGNILSVIEIPEDAAPLS
jgi:catechol 2,3-dioxygenase-like lactoylglutathione lyase family enzyme